MCGIAGLVSFSGHDPMEVQRRIEAAAHCMVHRGPDGEGFYVDGHAALGHRRLSIIDLSGGAQPMESGDGRFHIVFNGEIYNFPDLRSRLQARGHGFQSRSDTEVILVGYQEWGEQVVEKLHGMFAFAIWDKIDRTLFLARDRVGKKPLYYWTGGNAIAFASQLKALVNLCPNPGVLSPTAMDCYFSFGFVPTPLSIFENVKKLEPAHTLSASTRGFQKKRFWSLPFAPAKSLALEDALEEFESLLDDATRCRLMSEVPLGAFLSGGLDSTLVVSSMAKSMDQPPLTHSIGFHENGHDELPMARRVAQHLKTHHREHTLKPDAMEVLPRMAPHFDEPFADSSAVPTWYVCWMAKQHVTVALSGDGGDESFGGYSFRYLPHVLESKIRALAPLPLRNILFGALGHFYPGSSRLPRFLRLKTVLENLALDDAQAFYRDLIWLRPDARESIYSPDLLKELQGFTPFELVRPLYLGCSAPDPLSRSLYTDINFYMTEDVLVKVDRMSMAHSLEVRAPLLDHRILEFAARLPQRLKMHGTKGKILLRAAAARRLPPQIQHLPKQGFSMPSARWLRHDLKEMAHGLIFESQLVKDFLQRKKVETLWQEHQSGRRDHNVFLWGLMMLSLWEKSFHDITPTPITNPATPTPGPPSPKT